MVNFPQIYAESPSPRIPVDIYIFSLWRRNLSPYSLSCQIVSVSLEELDLPRLIRCELSRLRCHGHSLLLSSYLCRIKTEGEFFIQRLRTPLAGSAPPPPGLPASEPLQRAIFDTTSSIFYLWPRPCGVARLFGLRGVPPCPHPSEGVE